MNNIFFLIPFLLVVSLGIYQSAAAAPLPPNAPDLTNGTITSNIGVNLFWSAPEQNGGTGPITYNVKRSNDGSTFTSIANTTALTIIDTLPLEQTYGYYRIYSSDSLGQSTGYSFPLNQTSSTNVRTHLSYDYVLTDQGKQNNTPITNGTELYVAGRNGGARSFDGSSSDVMANESNFDFEHTQAFSLSFWVNITDNTTDWLIGKTTATGFPVPGYFVAVESGGTKPNLIFRMSTSATDYDVTTTPNGLDILTWHHVVITYSGNSNRDGIKIYVNGVLDATGTSASIASTILNNHKFSLGDDADGGAIPFTGSLDDVRIFTSEILANEVSQLYNERLYTGNIIILPNAVTDLIGVATQFATVTLDWTEPAVFGPILGYMINFTTPFGDPVSIVTNSTGNTLTSAEIIDLTIGNDYSFRVSPVTNSGTNSSGNIANVTATTVFELGSLGNPDTTNTDDFSIFYTRTDTNATSILLDVNYPIAYNLSCNILHKFSGDNNTYTGLTETPVAGYGNDTDTVQSSFVFNGANTDVITVTCTDTITNDSAKYIITVTDFELKNQINRFRDGTYGTAGQIGGLDLITLIIVIIGMIGFNRVTPVAGVVFTCITVGVAAYFEIIEFYQIMFPALALVVLLAYTRTRQSD